MDNLENWPGKERRFPSADNPCKFTLDRIKEEIIDFSRLAPKNAMILDFGCGESPYYPFFADKAKEYVGVDIDESPEKGGVAKIMIKQGEKIPFQGEYFDAIISTQVFEHIKDMDFYAKELKRVLKRGGIIFISAAFAWDYHPYPKDYWRVTEDGYRELFNEFSENKFSYDTNSLQTIIQSINLLMSRKGVKNKMFFRLINFIVSKINYKKGDIKLPGNMFVFLRK